MRKPLLLALGFSVALGAVAWAQSFSMPPPAGVSVGGCIYNTSPPTLTTGQTGFVQCGPNGTTATSTPAVAAINSGASAVSGTVLKATPGSLLSLTVDNGATAGWVMIFDFATVPADGATGASLKWCFPVQASSGVASSWPVPLSMAVGISVAFSSTTCSSKTASATAFFYAQIQ